ncbi:Uncharacterised protein [Corynebacterium kutscheri]|uniref:Uncharacterized protein n=1 Tax=Corynebacterium kutscheri TaxID=35755 RepID=A0A0F6R3C9_9CORY|nr:hypothetical protein UL82_10370 [Corynebacterium kutscheri]VEH05758.1 Uncharacterised protein [Corynebacterium kutscheri]VEH10551.1 Uncharacterised protein [Corynebacterium kutscheri]VEH81653.1 Uncharacterised protein [Corynebacterium kutscheri]
MGLLFKPLARIGTKNIVFYPRGYNRNISGTVDVTMHLMVTFKNFNGSVNSLRRDNEIPYALGFPVNSTTAMRLALQYLTWLVINSKFHIKLGSKRLALASVLDDTDGM